ncbi:Fic family protein [Dysgonomonas sp. PFB1-18]|uniref:Fic family protein n=1 Tax=unclassified Dysgonomonas TaxID=2630389 RepID=UPI0024750F5C|nr:MULTISPECIES: Fic family protein [unclassified Dysgonomonas]MDH6310494.1 Fic family protein [Dysgonomonas sp. PF1-14]MDH6340932.1 Fic family protein [Dysgonomonas sp. PF1-16]MDH6382738.1 Fic family protein [Dysgonomonas sp. PFB1-18]MDH6399873.1 Fic family protein [Dysgonomonas sp. PF1-23]
MGTKPIFNDIQLKKSAFILKNKYAKLSALSSGEIKNLAVVWCYYSGKIEGNTYTYVETEALLKDDVTSPKRYEDAKMLKNLYNSFITILEQISKEGAIDIDERTVLSIHSMLIDELVQTRDKGILRSKAVGITGTAYTPPKEADEIKERFGQILSDQYHYADPMQRAVYLHCNIARLQPFIDGNKRTSRLLESIVLINNDVIPVYSAKDEDLLNYRKGLIHFYETEDYSLYADYFLNRQIQRINEISLKTDIKFDLMTNRQIKPPVQSKGRKM